MTTDERYARIYTRWTRLMTRGVQKNREECNLLRQELKAMRDSGDVSQKVIETIPYIGGLGPIPPYPAS